MIVAGFGFREAATESSLKNALARTPGAKQVTHFATVAAKAGNPAFQSFAHSAGVAVVCVDAGTLQAQRTATHSAASLKSYGTGSMAEAAALAAAGPNAKLLAPRVVSADRKATCAIATGAET